MATLVGRTGWYQPPWLPELRRYTVIQQEEIDGIVRLEVSDATKNRIWVRAVDFLLTKEKAIAYCRAQAQSAAEHWALQIRSLEDEP